VEVSLRDDWLNKRLFNGLKLRVIDNTLIEDFRDVIKSDFKVLFEDNFMGLNIVY